MEMEIGIKKNRQKLISCIALFMIDSPVAIVSKGAVLVLKLVLKFEFQWLNNYF